MPTSEPLRGKVLCVFSLHIMGALLNSHLPYLEGDFHNCLQSTNNLQKFQLDMALIPSTSLTVLMTQGPQTILKETLNDAYSMSVN